MIYKERHHTYHIYSLQPAVEWVGGTNEPHVNGQRLSDVERIDHALEILGEALNHAATLHNYTLSSAINNITP